MPFYITYKKARVFRLLEVAELEGGEVKGEIAVIMQTRRSSQSTSERWSEDSYL